MNKLKMYKEENWVQDELAWDERAAQLQRNHPIKGLKTLPSMPGITEETAKGLKWKSFRYMLSHDHNWMIPKNFIKHPIRYTIGFFRSLLQKKPFVRDGDFFLYNIGSENEFIEALEEENTLLVLGFSYCHKPHECPSKRFTPDCIRDPHHPVCGQCFIGKALHMAPKEKTVPLIIPTIHYIGEKIFDVVHQNPGKKILFIISACELTLEMFGDWGNMVGIRGIGIRLDGRICNTMRAFELSEEGTKPGLTVVTPPTQKRVLDLLKHRKYHV
jgi:hypothetical protein